MSVRPEQPEPFLRGCVFPAVSEAPYPRANPAHAEHLPADIWASARLPVGVRLEMAGGARTVRIWYRTTTASLGYRGESAGCSFVAYRAGQKVASAEAVMGEGRAELSMGGRPDLPVTIYLPEGMQPLVTGVAGVEESMAPSPWQPRWLAYGDAATQGWLASAPAMAWPAVTGRKLGLDVCNLGYAGTTGGETTSAMALAETPAEVISIAFGLNTWSRVPHTAGLMAEQVRCFLSVVRQGHPDVPIVVVSPTVRPDAEDVPNRLGATLAELRLAMEDAVINLMADGDAMLFLIPGLGVLGPEDLEDGVYPGDEGHRRLAAAVSKVLLPHMEQLQIAAEKRWANEGVSWVAPRGGDRGTNDDAVSLGALAPETLDDIGESALGPEVPSFDGTLFDEIEAGIGVGGRQELDGDSDEEPFELDDDPIEINEEPFEIDDEPFEFDDEPVAIDDAVFALDDAPVAIYEAPVDIDDAPFELDATPAELEGTAPGLEGGAYEGEGSEEPTMTTVVPPRPAAAMDTTAPARSDVSAHEMAIADMVVTALSIATNGADDFFPPSRCNPDGSSVGELDWTEVGIPRAY